MNMAACVSYCLIRETRVRKADGADTARQVRWRLRARRASTGRPQRDTIISREGDRTLVNTGSLNDEAPPLHQSETLAIVARHPLNVSSGRILATGVAMPAFA